MNLPTKESLVPQLEPERDRLLKAQAAVIAEQQDVVLRLRNRISNLEKEKGQLREQIEWELWRGRVHLFKQGRLFRGLKLLAPGPVRRAFKRLALKLLGR